MNDMLRLSTVLCRQARTVVLISAALLSASAVSANAASCGQSEAGFEGWLDGFKRQATAQGISARTVNAALEGVTYDRRTIGLDRGQRSFKLSFEQFWAKRVSNAMIVKGRNLIKQHQGTLSQIEQRFGVPAPVLMAIWGLETAYGRDGSGNFAIIRSLATLAWDCRRSDFFRKELFAALEIVERGDLTPDQLRGGWAGEIGQTQFLVSSYAKFAVDFDGDGRRDLVHSVPDMLASTANFLKAKGWRRGEGWHAGTSNYEVIREWNKASVYVQTISVMADKIAGKA
jgi:lytic murein transglycosylase